MRTVLTEEEKRRFAAHIKNIASIGIAMEDLAAAIRKAALAMSMLKEIMKLDLTKMKK